MPRCRCADADPAEPNVSRITTGRADATRMALVYPGSWKSVRAVPHPEVGSGQSERGSGLTHTSKFRVPRSHFKATLTLDPFTTRQHVNVRPVTFVSSRSPRG